MLSRHRTVHAEHLDIHPAAPPFSSFNFIESYYKGLDSLRRCFSLARSFGVQTVTVEKIPALGLIEEENLELSEFFPDHKCLGLERLCFWKKQVHNVSVLNEMKGRDLIGYAILKRDRVKSANYDRWHVFEAVFRKYPHHHNCIPRPKTFKVACGERLYSVKGILYCQQNSLNKACAHVALRSLVSNHLANGDITYKQINELAGITPQKGRIPGTGLSVKEIRNVLRGLDIGFRDIDYVESPELREDIPYQKVLYAGVESGAGALLGFRLTGPDISEDAPPRHIIPFFGHTFNKDTWVPDAELSYFDVGGGVGYVPSENWTSSFIGHDDNFGPNYCVPRCHVARDNVDYVVELFNKEAKFGGVHAEAVSLGFIYSLTPSIAPRSRENPWIKRLMHFIRAKKIVLRALFVKKETYIGHLRNSPDWEGNTEHREFLQGLEGVLPSSIWVTEISIPQLFPANERKVGEVILNPFVRPDTSKDVDFDLFLMARIPCYYFFLDTIRNDNPMFLLLNSNITSHMPLLKHG